MKIAILTSGILPVPAVLGGAVETLIDHYLEYNNVHRLHDITVFSVYHPQVKQHPALASDVNHYRYIDTSSWKAKVRKRLHGMLHKQTYYHYTIDYFLQQALPLIKKGNYDCIILENRPGYALNLNKSIGAKLIYHLHNDFLHAHVSKSMEIYQAADLIVTVSDYIRQRVLTCQTDDVKTVTVYNGIDLKPFSTTPTVTRQSLGYNDDDFILAFSGRLIPEKGILELIKAMNLLADHPQIKLLVMGSSFLDHASNDAPFVQQLKTSAKDISDRIRFTGYVEHHLIPHYLKLADVASLPSTWEEPFGLTVVEGMAAGLPIITTDRGAIPEIVTDQNAIIIPCSSDLPQRLAQAIMTLYQDSQRRHLMGDASIEFSKNYSKEQYAEQFLKAIASIAD